MAQIPQCRQRPTLASTLNASPVHSSEETPEKNSPGTTRKVFYPQTFTQGKLEFGGGGDLWPEPHDWPVARTETQIQPFKQKPPLRV